MIPNIGKSDRVLRFVSGILFTLLGVFLSSGLLVIAGLFTIFEALSSWCVFYQLIGKNTCLVKSKKTVFPFLKILVLGFLILLVAIIFNFLADSINFNTWYDIFTAPNLKLSLDNIIFLFVVYPLAMGITAYFFLKSKD